MEHRAEAQAPDALQREEDKSILIINSTPQAILPIISIVEATTMASVMQKYCVRTGLDERSRNVRSCGILDLLVGVEQHLEHAVVRRLLLEVFVEEESCALACKHTRDLVKLARVFVGNERILLTQLYLSETP